MLTHQAEALRTARFLLGDEAAARDCVQEALLSAWRALPSFQATASFRSWLHSIVRHAAIDHLRRPATRSAGDPLESATEPSTPAGSSPEQTSVNVHMVERVHAALRGLPAELHHAWVLREVHGLSYAEVARRLNCSEPTARGRIYRARTRVAHALEEWR